MMADSAQGTPMASASGRNTQPARVCSVMPVKGSMARFTSATSATKTINMAMMPSSSCSPSVVPWTSASMEEV